MPARFPPPWSVEEQPVCFVVRALPLGPFSALGEAQKSESASGKTRGTGGLEAIVVIELSSLLGAVLVRVFSISSRRARFLKLRRAR